VILPSDTHADIRALYAYWDRKRAGRSMPARADFDPIDIPTLMPQIFIVDVRNDGRDLTYRLFGTGLVMLFGRELTGQRVGEGQSVNAANESRARYCAIVRDRLPYFHQARLREPHNDFTDIERLILPLSPNDVRVDMLIGMVIPIRWSSLPASIPSQRRLNAG
jgi:hypothetical protein